MAKTVTIIRGLIISVLLCGYTFAVNPVYVNSASGNDLNDGSTPGTAKQTIQAGLTVVDAGGTVYVASGSYAGFTVNTANVTVTGDPGTVGVAGPGPSAPMVTGLVLVNSTGVTITGFDISNPTGPYGIQVGPMGGSPANGAVISYNKVHDVNGSSSGDGIRLIELEPCSNVEVKFNIVGYSTPTNPAASSYTNTIAGIFARAAGGNFNNIKIEDNIVRNITQNNATGIRSANGIWVGGSAGVFIFNGLSIKRNQVFSINCNLGVRGILINHGNAVNGVLSADISNNNIHNLTGTFAYGIAFEQYTPSAVLRHNSISYLFGTPATNIAGIDFENNSNPSSLTIEFNSFNVQFGVRNATSYNATAEGNWWGDTDPSDNILQSPGLVDYSPWWGADYNADSTHPWTWLVLPGDNIQDVIDAASENDIILVPSGSYGPITLNKNGLILTGNPAVPAAPVRNDGRNRMSPEAFPGPTFERINIDADNISIYYVHINNPAGGAGIYNTGTRNNILMDFVETITIDDGASFNEVNELLISNATFKNSTAGTGLKILNTTALTLTDVDANNNFRDGIHLELVTNVNGTNLAGIANGRYGLNLGESSTVEIENGTFSNNLDGLHIHPHWDSDLNTTDQITGLDLSGTWVITNNIQRGIVLQSDGNGLSGATNTTYIISPVFNGSFTLSGNGTGGINIFGAVSDPHFNGFAFTGASYGMLIHGLSGMAYQPSGVVINNSTFNNFGSTWPNFAISLSDYVSRYSTNDVNAKYNLWNGTPVPNVESILWHKNDDAALGLIETGQVILSYPANGSLGHPLKPRLEWLAHVPAVSYTIQIADNANFAGAAEYTVSSPILAFDIPSNLLNNTRYYWRVKAKETNVPLVYCAWSNPWNFKTTATGISGVQIPNLFNPINNLTVYTLTPTLSWGTFQAGITSYQLQYTSGDAAALAISAPIFVASAGNATNYTLPELVAGTTYLWRVRSFNSTSGIYSGWSDPEDFTVDASQGPTTPYPSYPVSTTVYTNHPTLYWYTLSAATGILFDIELQRLTPSFAVIPLINNTNIATLNYAVQVLPGNENLLAAGDYQWRVTAHKPGYSTPSAWTPYTVAPTALNIPVKPIISWPADGALLYSLIPTLNWYTGSYNINIVFDWEISTSAAVDGFGAFTSVVDFGTNAYAPVTVGVGPLSNGTLYYWHVRARNTVNSLVSDWSDMETFQTTAGTGGVPGQPSLVYPTGGIIISNLIPLMSWSAPSPSGPIENYWLELATENDFSGAFTILSNAALTGLTYQVTSGTLINGVTYYWRVRASYPGGFWGAPTAAGSFTTMAGSAPVVPMAASPVYGTVLQIENPSLSWYLPTKGSSLTYELQYSSDKEFTNAVTVEGLDKPAYDLFNLPKGQYYWRVRSKNIDGEFSFYSQRNEFRIGEAAVTSVEEKAAIPDKFEVMQNYPNPFNPTTTIQFGIPEGVNVTVRIYDMLGREIKTLINEDMQPGNYKVEWNGDTNYGQMSASGTYIYRVTAGSNIKSMKMILLK